MNLMLFLGSGVSLPSGLPDTNEITRIILEEEWHSHTDECYYPGPQLNPYFRKENLVLRIQPFLQLLKSHADNYLSKRRKAKATYEDLYWLARQIVDDEYNEIENPAVEPFVLEIKKNSRNLLGPIPGTKKKLEYSELADRTCKFIHCAVWNCLSNQNSPMGMDLIKDLAQSDEIDNLDIFTINHDILLESLFKLNSISFAEGFGVPEGEVRFFDPSVYNEDQKIRIFKLHGSIRWFRFRRYMNEKAIDRYGIPIHNDSWHCKDLEGEYYSNLDGSPALLTGTYNKMMAYGFSIFSEMHNWFHQLLRQNNLMIMSGYGWNDRGINGRLLEWLYWPFDRRLILLHQNPEIEIREKSKSAMWHRYDNLVKDGKLVPIKKWLCDVTLEEMFEIIKKC